VKAHWSSSSEAPAPPETRDPALSASVEGFSRKQTVPRLRRVDRCSLFKCFHSGNALQGVHYGIEDTQGRSVVLRGGLTPSVGIEVWRLHTPAG
jgi:hypothetical protein